MSNVQRILRIQTPADSYVIHVDWPDDLEMPRDLGPFPTRTEAEEFIRLNIRTACEIRVLSWPYYIRDSA